MSAVITYWLIKSEHIKKMHFHIYASVLFDTVDARSRLFLHYYEEAAKMLEKFQKDVEENHPLVRLNCYDWTDICLKENITTYPTVRIYRSGQSQEYLQELDKDVLVQTVRL